MALKHENFRLQEETVSQQKALASLRVTTSQLSHLLEEAEERVASLELKRTMTQAEEKLKRIERCLG